MLYTVGIKGKANKQHKATMAFAIFSRFLSWLGLTKLSSETELGDEEQVVAKRVAVIGGGVGGAASAFFLKQSLAGRVQIDVFEPGRLGGRVESFKYEGKVYELGASILYYGNKYFREIADKVKAKRVSINDGTRLRLYDGKEFVLKFSWWTLVNYYRIWYRYGFVPLSYSKLIKDEFLSKFMKIYTELEQGKAYTSPGAMLEDVDMYSYTQFTSRKLLEDKFGTQPGTPLFISELAAASTRVNYNQGMDINAFAGLVSYTPAADDNLFRLKDGNDSFSKLTLEYANAKVVQASVKKVTKQDDNTFDLEVLEKEDVSVHSQYDAVILAAPLESAGLKFRGMNVPEPPQRRFKTTITTYIRGKIKPSYFNEESLPRKPAIFMTENADVPFSSVAFKEQFKDGSQLYKVFSTDPLSDGLLDEMFDDPTVIITKPWAAYPVFNPPEQFGSCVLAPGFFYNNAIETSASAMEMSAIAAKNSVNWCLKSFEQMKKATQS